MIKINTPSAEWWHDILAMMTEPPDPRGIERNIWLPVVYRCNAFFEALRPIPQVTELEGDTWDELTGMLYDCGLIVTGDGQIFFDKISCYFYCSTFAGKLVGYVVKTPKQFYARLDSRLEIINN